jgi:hypothetical protein
MGVNLFRETGQFSPRAFSKASTPLAQLETDAPCRAKASALRARQ